MVEEESEKPKLVALTGILITSVSSQIMAYPSQLDILIKLGQTSLDQSD